MNECSFGHHSKNPLSHLTNRGNQPLRIVHAGVYMYGGGAERWLKSVAENFPASIRIERSLILGRKFFDRKFANQMPFPVQIVNERLLREKLRFVDVLLYWGPVPIDKCLQNLNESERPSLVLFGAHSAQSRPSLELGARSVDYVLCVGEHIKKKVSVDFPSFVIHPVADAAHTFTSLARMTARERLGYAPEDFVIGFVGSFSQNKRPQSLLDALSCLPTKFKALLVGSGGEFRSLRRRAKQKAPWRVTFARGESGMGNFYRAMDAVCVPSESEGFSLVPLEAMQSGIPLLVTPHGDIPIFFRHLENAWILDPLNLEDSIVAGVRYLESEEAGRTKIIRGGNYLSQKFGTIQQHSSHFASLLRDLWEQQRKSWPASCS